MDPIISPDALADRIKNGNLPQSVLQAVEQKVNQAAAAPVLKTGLTGIRIGAQFAVPIEVNGESRRAQMIVRDATKYPHARVSHVCLHEDCAGKRFASLDDLVKAHRPQADYEARVGKFNPNSPTELAKAIESARANSHPIGLYSDDPETPGDPLARPIGLMSAMKWEP